MTRNPANSPNADDSWEQLEADLFGIEVGKEHTAHERVASEPAAPAPAQPIAAVAKPIEEDDFGDFGAGLVEPAPAPAPRKSSPPQQRVKPVPPVEPTPAKALPEESVPAFQLSDLDEGPTDEELDEAEDDDEAEAVDAEAAAPEDDPYWDALANWNWQEDDRSGKPRSDSSRDRSRASGPAGRGDRSQRGDRGPRGRSGEHRPAPPRESRPATTEDRGHSAPRRPTPDRDRGRMDETPSIPVAEVPELERDLRPAAEEHATAPADVKSRRQDRRRSRRHTHASDVDAGESVTEDRSAESPEENWPAAETPKFAPTEPPRSRALPVDDLDDDFEEETTEAAEFSAEPAGDEERAPRRRRSRRRRRRPERPTSAQTESAADEDIKHLEEDDFGTVEDDILDEQLADEEAAVDEEDVETQRPSRSRRPRRRRRGGRPDRPAPAPVARVEPEFDDEEDEDVEEILETGADEEFDEDQDLEFVEEELPARSSRRQPRSRRSASDTPFVRHIEDDDDEDSEPEPAVSYEDVPSWEEAISYLLNPSMVEGAGGDRGGDRGAPSNDRGYRGGERSSRPPRRGPRRDA